MSSNKFTLSFFAIIVAMVLVCQMASAADSAVAPTVNGTSNGTVVVKPAASNNASVAHLRVRRKGLGGVGGAVAGGLASGAAMTAIGGLFGGRV